MDRRRFVERTALTSLSVVGLTAGLNRGEAEPAAPTPTPAVPAEPDIYTFQFGGSKAFVILDGTLRLATVQPLFAPEATKAQIDEQLYRNFIPSGSYALGVNVLVLKTGSGVALFDAGAGRTFGPAAGRLLAGLAKIGVKPQEVKTVYLTHAHLDHIGGLVDNADAPLFPSARIIASRTEVSFWTGDSPDVSGMALAPDETASLLRAAKHLLGRLQSRLELHEPGRVSAEVEMIAGPGHTPGHTLFQVRQGGESLLVMGDAAHLEWLEFAHPEWTMAYDTQPRQAVATRRRLLEGLARNRGALFGCHMSFPGMGHVRAWDGAFEWVPRPWV